MDYKLTMGLEVHASITDVEKKLFSKGKNRSDNDHPNSCIDLLDLGIPGALPVLNHHAVFSAIKACSALNMKINQTFTFDRKSYFYPDLPLGYQITQFFQPIGIEGWLPIFTPSKRKIRIKQLHMETDAGKSIHHDNCTLLDFNRSGSPLMEIVTYPDFHSIEEVLFFVRTLRATLKNVGTSDCAMEKGNFRVDVNISISNNDELGTRVEIKNLNSYRSIRKAIEFEYERQKNLILNGEKVQQETRLFNEAKGSTFFTRNKEDASDYMYFPDPDLPEFTISGDIIESLKNLPHMPYVLMEKLYEEMHITENLLNLTEEPAMALFVESALNGMSPEEKKQILKLICGKIFFKLAEDSCIPISPDNLKKLAKIALKDKPNESVIKTLIDEMWETNEDPEIIMKEKGLNKIKDIEQIRHFVVQSITDNPNELQKYLNGKNNLRAFFLGQVMKNSNNLCDINLTNRILDEELEKLKVF